ncbi:uncharacterized protein LOC129252763 [Anastrepha obliqua]|uniref:uncharacterized protein LOC129252763 n=1 Tax=Anastrepha obliqua TaxID=95512 RepID=UPI002409EFE7|nr:uncharacterized protein LOC129252763 [Anastrepha obliqua]
MKRHICIHKITLALFVLCICGVKCEITIVPDALYYNITTTPRADLYHMHNQRQFTVNVKELEQSLLNFKASYHARLDVIGLNIDLLETKLEEVDNRLNPLMLLDDINDYCVQKHRVKLPQITQLTIKMKKCTLKGTNAYAGIVSAAERTLRNLKSYYTNTLASAVNDCKTKHAGNFAESNYTTCVSTAVNNAATKTHADTNKFQNQMKTAECTAGTKVREIFDCYSVKVFSAIKIIGEVMELVENCITGQKFCPSCGDETAFTKGRCPYHLGWHLAESDLTSEKINNPFKGISKTTPCLQINFINIRSA